MAGKVSLGGIALVTGASLFIYPHHEPSLTWLIQAGSGIGKETALAFAEAGAKGVAFADINEEGALAAAEESKKFAKDASFKAIAVKVDITDEASVDNMVQTVLKEFGRIDYSVNSAGVWHPPRVFPVLSMTNAEVRPDRQPLLRNANRHRSGQLFSYPRSQCPRHYAVRACCFEGYGRTRTAQL